MRTRITGAEPSIAEVARRAFSIGLLPGIPPRTPKAPQVVDRGVELS